MRESATILEADSLANAKDQSPEEKVPITRGQRRKRLVDLALVLLLAPLASLLGAVIALIIRISSKGPVLYWSERVGQNNKLFRMPKFRTMRIDTPQIATHLMQNPHAYLIRGGGFLRRSSLDELPQLWSVLRGDLSLVGPRPALFNQDDLIALRNERHVSRLKPGITGWAQVNGRDELPIPAKVEFDAEYAARQSLLFDIHILLQTIFKVVRSEGVKH